MQAWGSFVRAACCTTFALVLASACGGRSVERDESDAGEAGRGSTTSRAGSSSTGGATARAGSSSSGGTTGRAGSSGNSNSGQPCSAVAEVPRPDGTICSAYIPRWTHDAATGICRPFYYSGCGATANNYETLEACQAACPGGKPNYDACQVPSDCALATLGCCGICDGVQISTHDFVAYNKQYEAQVSPCASADIACDPCVPTPSNQATRKYFIPNCVNSQCVVEDIRESAVTACKSSQDCRLRHGTDCCEGCGYDDLVAIRNDGSFEKLVCDGVAHPCPACLPMTRNDAVPICEDNGHCGITYLLK